MVGRLENLSSTLLPSSISRRRLKKLCDRRFGDHIEILNFDLRWLLKLIEGVSKINIPHAYLRNALEFWKMMKENNQSISRDLLWLKNFKWQFWSCTYPWEDLSMTRLFFNYISFFFSFLFFFFSFQVSVLSKSFN